MQLVTGINDNCGKWVHVVVNIAPEEVDTNN